MGLNCTHEAWDGAYSAFGRWRDQVARAAGYAVWPVIYDDMKSQNGSGFGRDTVMIDWGHISEENIMGEWVETPSDPLIVLIAHSDCEGFIYREQQIPLAERLEGLIPALAEFENEQPGMGHIARWGGLAGCAKRFAEGLRRAHSAREDLGFH